MRWAVTNYPIGSEFEHISIKKKNARRKDEDMVIGTSKYFAKNKNMLKVIGYYNHYVLCEKVGQPDIKTSFTYQEFYFATTNKKAYDEEEFMEYKLVSYEPTGVYHSKKWVVRDGMRIYLDDEEAQVV